MKGLTLTQKEQARLQVLNGILEGQISVDEAAEVLGVSERHVGESWRSIGRRVPPHWLMGTEVAERTTPSRRRPGLKLWPWHAHGMQE